MQAIFFDTLAESSLHGAFLWGSCPPSLLLINWIPPTPSRAPSFTLEQTVAAAKRVKLRFGIQDFEFTVIAFGSIQVLRFGFTVKGLGFKGSDQGFRAEGEGDRVQGFGVRGKGL